MQVSIIGAGYVGLVTGLCLADRGHRVACVDVDARRIDRLAAGELPIHEPGLSYLLARHLGSRFVPTTDLTDAVRESELTMIAVGTPIGQDGIDLSFVADAAAAVGRVMAGLDRYHVVVVKSTVVPGTTDGLVRTTLEATSRKRSGVEFGLGMNPEFLREGQAVDDFQNADRIVIGAVDQRSREVMDRLYADYRTAAHLHTNTRTAEMIKYASNALLATLISFANEIGNLCSAVPDIDVVDVLSAVELDKRISPPGPNGTRIRPGITAYLKAGCGFGGSCFPKDVRALIRWGADHDRPTRMLKAVIETNATQPLEVVRLLEKHFPDLAGRTVAVLGLAFKPDTDDIRESPALPVMRSLLAAGADVVAYDPVAISAMRATLDLRGVRYAPSLTDAVLAADAILLLTAWPEFQQVPALAQCSSRDPVIVDGRRVLDKGRTPRYEGIGLR